jgi:hypothetical protein
MTRMTTPNHTPRADDPGHPEAMTDGDHHGVTDHGSDGEHDDHAHDDGDELGPVDVAAWGAGALGVLLGVLVALCFWFATLPTQAA